MKKGESPQLRLPEQDLGTLSFCKAEANAVKEWLDTLPMANLGSTTRSLFEAIDEINRLKIAPQQRFDILEQIRPVIYYAAESLEKHYLNQPLTLSEQAKKIADLAQALQGRLATGYIIVTAQCGLKMRGFRLSKPKQLMAQAIHRAICDLSQQLLRYYQLYRPAPKYFWQDIHRLHLLAQEFNLEMLMTNDPQCGEEHQSSLSDAYLRTLLLGCIKANQLRQEDIKLVSGSLMDEWLGMIELTAVDQKSSNLLVVDPHKNSPPVYQKFYQGAYNKDCHCLDTSVLVTYLKSQIDNQEPTALSKNLLSHLVIAWGVLTDRTFMRLEANDTLALCLGLSTTHYFVSDARSFDRLMHGDKARGTGSDSLFLVDHEAIQHHDAWDDAFDSAKGVDVWDTAFKAEGESDKQRTSVSMESIDYHVHKDGKLRASTSAGNSPEENAEQGKYQDYQVQMLNLSPGGYCLEWSNSAPSQLKTGEIIGVKETHHNAWSIGAIRWVRMDGEKGLQIGVELLSPTATPYGARVLHKMGDAQSEYMRVLVLPEVTSTGQAKTLITPAVSFKENQKVMLAHNGREVTVLLTRLVFSSGYYSQFEFSETKRISDEKKQQQRDKLSVADDSFDSLWKNL